MGHEVEAEACRESGETAWQGAGQDSSSSQGGDDSDAAPQKAPAAAAEVVREGTDKVHRLRSLLEATRRPRLLHQGMLQLPSFRLIARAALGSNYR